MSAHVFLRYVLSRYVDLAPEVFTFAVTAHGRPSVVTPAGYPLHFTLSHTRELIACAVATEPEIGVDVEMAQRVVRQSVAEIVLSPAERAVLRALPAAARSRRLIQWWTLKEAYAKARGLGLALPFDLMWFQSRRGSIRARFQPVLDDDPSTWQFTLLRLRPGHVLALAIRRRSAEPWLVRVRRWDGFPRSVVVEERPVPLRCEGPRKLCFGSADLADEV